MRGHMTFTLTLTSGLGLDFPEKVNVNGWGFRYSVKRGRHIPCHFTIQITICPFYWNNTTKLDMLWEVFTCIRCWATEIHWDVAPSKPGTLSLWYGNGEDVARKVGWLIGLYLGNFFNRKKFTWIEWNKTVLDLPWVCTTWLQTVCWQFVMHCSLYHPVSLIEWSIAL